MHLFSAVGVFGSFKCSSTNVYTALFATLGHCLHKISAISRQFLIKERIHE